MAKNDELLAAFKRLTPAQRDYDRFVARRIPHGASWVPETENGKRMSAEQSDRSNDYRGCSCQMWAPCSWCESLTEEEADVYWNDGIQAVLNLRAAREEA